MNETLGNGRYRIDGELGHGGMSTAYLAHDEELGRPVAVKVLDERLVGEAGFRERFDREARLSARLSHPNVVAVFDVGEEEGLPFIVMEYVEGETLTEALREQGAFEPQEAVEVGIQAATGLQHAHEHGLVHRDVKPGNLFRRPDGLVKIGDFGIAHAVESTRLTLAGEILGTAAYLSPEQAAGEEVTPASDVYALGAVLYELLTGRPPFEIKTLSDLEAKQREGAVTAVRAAAPHVPPALEEIVMRCLAPDPALRPASAAELARELAQTTAAPESGAEPREAPTAVLARPVRAAATRRPPWPWLAAAAAVLAAAGIGLGIALGTEDGSNGPAQIESPARGANPAEEARNLSDWLRAHER